MSFIYRQNNTNFFYGQRWLNILLRSFHLVGVSGVGSGYFFALPETQWLPFLQLTLFSGLAMMMLEIWSQPIWLIQIRGLSTLLKLSLLSMSFYIGLQAEILIAVILIAGVISHAPGKVRYFSPFTSILSKTN